MPSQDLHVDIDGDAKGFDKACKSAETSAKAFERELAKLEKQQKKTQDSLDDSSGSSKKAMLALTSLAGAGSMATPAFAAAGVGIAAFGALAVPSIMKVVTAYGDMAAQWDTLSTDQKIAVSNLDALASQFEDLSKAVEPEALRVFNDGLSVVGALLPHLEPLTRATAKALSEFADKAKEALNSEQAAKFFQVITEQAGPGIEAIGDTVGNVIGLATNLIISLAPLASAGLGVVGMFSNLVGILGEVTPGLAEVAVLTATMRGPIAAVGGAIGAVGGKYKEFANGAKSAGLATKALNLVSAAGPNLYIAAGIAIAYFAVRALTAQSATEKLVASLAVANRASGNNVVGYQALSNQLTNNLNRSTAESTAFIEKHGSAMQAAGGKVPVVNYELQRMVSTQRELKTAIESANTAMGNVTSGADALAKKYGITQTQALSLADAVGINLSKGILENGEITAKTAAKFDQYRMAVEQANDPTAMVKKAWQDAGNAALTLKDRINAVAQAFEAYANPALAMLQATNQMTDTLKESNKVLDNSKASTLEKNKALATHLGTLAQWAQAEFKSTGSVDTSNKAMMNQLPTLLKLAGNTKTGIAAVDGLIKSMGGSITRTNEATIVTDKFGNRVKVLPSGKVVKIDANTSAAEANLLRTKGKLDALKSKTLTITTYFKQIGEQPNAAPRTARAAGGPISGPGTATSDSIPAWLSDGEYVINAKQTAKHRSLIEAINADRLAGGGLVGLARGGRASSGGSDANSIGKMLAALLGGGDQAGSGAPTIYVTNHYPRAEPTSKTTNRALQYAGSMGMI